MKEFRGLVIQVILMVSLIIGTAFGISTHYVSRDVFQEFKEGTIKALWTKINEMDDKLDLLLGRQHGSRAEDQTTP